MDLGAGKLKGRITYLEMTQPPAAKLALLHAERPPPDGDFLAASETPNGPGSG